MSFRVRTALVVLLVTSVTMGLAFGAVWYLFVSGQQAALDAALLEVAQREAKAAADGRAELTDSPGPVANSVGPLPKYGVLYRRTGAPLYNTRNMSDPPAMPKGVVVGRGFDFDYEGAHMRGVLVDVGATGRHILLAAPRDDLEDDVEILTRAMAAAFAVGCLWAAVVGFWVATRITREHRTLASVARRVAAGDTSARVPADSAGNDLRQLAADVNAMIEQLVGLLAVRERFVAHAAHELRTPLTSLRIELEHALACANDRREYEEAVRGALDSAVRLSSLAEDLLQLARMRSVASDSVAPLDAALADAVADVARIAGAQGVRIVADVPSVQVRGDQRGLARMLRNVLENAVRYSPEGGTVRIETEREAAGDGVRVAVLDDGPGIAEGDEDRIFEPFARGAGGADAGTGLGLAIARGLARSFGGDVVAERGPGGRVFVTLRADDGERASDPALPSALEVAPSGALGR